MSRAVDESLKSSLRNGDHGEAYNAISQELVQIYSQHLDIELLPKDYDVGNTGVFFLKQEHHIAIPKLRLLQAFIVARRILKTHLNNPDSTCARDVQKATSVMLLMDSEHLTAANTRKRLLSRQTLTKSERRMELENDMFFINSLLSSHLHRHTKSPVLWSHKRWLLRQYVEAEIPMDPTHDMETVVYVAAERHPMNYYAWTYARALFSCPKSMTNADCDDEQFVKMTIKWCRIHHNDTSGWSFLLVLAIQLPHHASDIFTQTIRVVRMYSWRSEAVWNFLRNLVLLPPLRDNPETRQQFVDLWEEVRRDVHDDASLEAKVLDRAAAWARIRAS